VRIVGFIPLKVKDSSLYYGIVVSSDAMGSIDKAIETTYQAQASKRCCCASGEIELWMKLLDEE